MNSNSIQSFLQGFPLFKNLSDFEIEPIIDIAMRKVYQDGTHIFMQGDELTNVYFIQEGLVKIYKTDINGKEQIVNILQSGDMFPHQGFFRQDNYPAHAEAINEIVLFYIPIKAFEDLLIMHPEISIKIFRVLGDIIVDLQNRLGEKMFHSTYEQIIMLLLRLAKSHGEVMAENKIRITTQFTNREFANMIGSSRETVSRTLTLLRKQASMDTDPNGYLILYLDKLDEQLL
ncbi:MAG TPA: Crp/Fnr family transcriptional regulator [Virgibacillus sp.]|nr:Crp/Fnr family transcriptional regulator [Virgibacillus sp.]